MNEFFEVGVDLILLSAATLYLGLLLLKELVENNSGSHTKLFSSPHDTVGIKRSLLDQHIGRRHVASSRFQNGAA